MKTDQQSVTHLRILKAGATFYRAVATYIADTIAESIRLRGLCIIVLAGGETPVPAYRLLHRSPLVSRIDWKRVHILWSDERMVPPDHPESNYRMVYRALISKVLIPQRNVHRMRGELPAEEAAASYAKELRSVFPHRPMRCDLVILGIGQDGHTASLFPGTAAVREGRALTRVVRKRHLSTVRVTLTLPMINQAREVLFLVSGEGKAEMVRRVLGHRPSYSIPASLVKPVKGVLHWMVDDRAALRLFGHL